MVNKVFRFSWGEWKWMILIVMLGINMYWTAILVEPTRQLLEEANNTQRAIESSQAEILENQNNATKQTNDIVNKTETIEQQARENFFELQTQHENTTEAIVVAESLNLKILSELNDTQQALLKSEAQANATRNEISDLTNAIYTMQKVQLQALQTIGKQAGIDFENVTKSPEAAGPN